MNTRFVILLSVILFISCKGDNTNANLEGSQTFELLLNKITFDGEQPLYPRGCLTHDSLMVVFEPKDRQGFLYVYNIYNKSFIRKIGKKGESPNEFVRPRFITNNSTLRNQDLIIGDINGLYSLDITSDSIQKKEETIFPANLETYNYVLHNSPDTLIVNQTREHQLTIYNKKNDQIFFKDYYDKELLEKPVSEFANVNIVFDAYYTSNNNLIMIAYKNFKIIDLISKETLKLVKRIYFPGYDYNQYNFSKKGNQLRISKNSKLFFTYAYPLKNGFYVLSLESGRDAIENGLARPIIYEILNDGTINNIYKLNQVISSFCIKKDTIYGIGLSDLDKELCIFQGKI